MRRDESTRITHTISHAPRTCVFSGLCPDCYYSWVSFLPFVNSDTGRVDLSSVWASSPRHCSQLVDWESLSVLRLSMVVVHLTLCNTFHPTGAMLAAKISQLIVLSRDLFPFELVDHDFWWNAPDWLRLPSANFHYPLNLLEKKKEILVYTLSPTIQLWSYLWNTYCLSCTSNVSLPGFVTLSTTVVGRSKINYISLSVDFRAETYWISLTQQQAFATRLKLWRMMNHCPSQVIFFLYICFSISSSLIRVGGRCQNAQMP